MHNMSTPSHIEAHTPMTAFTGHTKSSATSESLTALNNFKRVKKGVYQPIPSSRMIFTMITSFLVIKAQGLYDVADPDYDPGDADRYEQELFQENNLLFILYWLLLFSQTR